MDYRQHLEVETPEHVVLDYEIAGVGSRTLAAFLDWLILFVLTLVSLLGLGLWREISTWLLALQVLLLYALIWGYFTGFEGLLRGQTPGKRWMGIRVIRDTGHPVTVADAAARNLLLPIDLVGFAGVFFIAIHPQAKRIGDLVAGTVVVRDHPVLRGRAGAEPEPAPPEAAGAAGAPELSDSEFRLLREFARRKDALPAPARARHTRALALKFTPRYPARAADEGQFLEELYRDELARRRGKLGGRVAVSGEAARRAAVSSAERLVALKEDRWAGFQALADRVGRQGLDALSAAELPEFAARYREVAADLARARTYRADPNTLAGLERLVAAGHNALYRTQRRTWGRIREFLLEECPGAVIGAARSVALAAGLFTVAALAGYGLLRGRPDLAP
ncbi:MAG TPA: RDD family protein, partial [Gemmatimonadales bacterium]|nr:RDD family protein [Gemmatimonadales bacterium]